ncbi:MAG: SdpI family protein, partial [Candidatus Diapherotrites archaeon]|nr:SdpI family protein [Candidatus Diapherotrites archaeon]
KAKKRKGTAENKSALPGAGAKRRAVVVFKLFSFALTIIVVVAGFWVLPMLPGVVPTHWNAAGQIDGYGPNWIAAMLMPLIMAGMLLFFALIPRIDVFKHNLKMFEREYWALACVLMLFFAALFAMILAPNFGFKPDVVDFMVISFALLFAAIGYLMPRFKRNFFVGIRTPWTLASDAVWKKTHAAGGKLFMLCALLSVLSLFAPAYAFFVTVGSVLVAAIALVVYSYFLFKKTGAKLQL